ncbi:hypothetical protein EPUS_06204 [Endocarpon pusillum Z07020]|uniref:PH domain-containing protein n=1 Tax=Endocarpon pusillum (strain Z07020 / HMAS-L-300199) TaxID=1263415 RepID=U1I018_ENDPU|nr:uncharacterized protein EPUS_06204 [Endocarpon pusillum Z07020]ERF75164.1 hypothetical protein EPUS_06204 [Endocarpon pusillum Z07020]
MTFLSKLCIAIGLVFLAHAGYSAHEYSAFYSRIHSANTSTVYSLPLDIRIETIVSVFLICFGLVAGADPLKPINWNVWAGNIEKEGGARNPFRGLEERAGFVDIRAKRKEFADWIHQLFGTGKTLKRELETAHPLNGTANLHLTNTQCGSLNGLRTCPLITIWKIPLTPLMNYQHSSQPKELSQRIPSQLREAIKDPAAAYITQQLGALPIRHRVRKDRQNVITILRNSEKERWLSDGSEDSEGPRRRARIAERSSGSWLDLHSDNDQAVNAPPARISSTEQSAPATIDLLASTHQSHSGYGSLDTVKQEDIAGAAKSKNSPQNGMKSTINAAESLSAMNDRSPSLRQEVEKSRPETSQTEETSPARSDPADASPPSNRRAFTTSGSASQRQKRRVIWKGKACYVTFPSHDERGRRPLLSVADVDARMKQWEIEGQDIRGFRLSTSSANEELAAQTCRLYPDPTYVLKEREGGQFRVSVPNQAEWDAYVNLLKEEKLLALGVSLSDNNHPPSTQYSFPALISRASSRFPGQSLSPPIPTSSAVSNDSLANRRSFSPGIPTSNASAQYGFAPSVRPQHALHQNSMHRSGKPLAYPGTDLRRMSPFSPSPLHPTLPMQREDLPSAYYVPQSEGFSISRASVPHQQHQQNNTGTTLSDSSRPPDREQEMMHPAPQSPQRNISEALQNEIDAAEEAIERSEKSVLSSAAPTLRNNVEITQQSERPLSSHGVDFGRNGDRADVAPLKSSAAFWKPMPDGSAGSQANASQHHSDLLLDNTDHINPHVREGEPSLLSVRPSGGRAHEAMSFASKLNVEAEEFKFNPRSQFLSTNFAFNRDAFQPSTIGMVPFSSHNGLEKTVLSKPKPKPVNGLNADAPSFTPSTISTATFQFNSAAFNIGDTASKPAQTVSERVLGQDVDTGNAGGPTKIFTNLTSEPNGKAIRRGKLTKVLPIGEPDGGDHTEDDEDGRVRVSAARQKRARVDECHDGDKSPQYATATTAQGDDMNLISSEADLRPPVSVEVRNKNAPSAIVISQEEGHERGLGEEHPGDVVRVPTKMQSPSSQPDPNHVQFEGEAQTTRLLVERNDVVDRVLENGNVGNFSPTHHTTVSLPSSSLSNPASRKASAPLSLTSKPQQSTGPEALEYTGTPPSSPPATTTYIPPLQQLLAPGDSRLSQCSEPAGESEAHSGHVGSSDEGVDTPPDNTDPTARSGNVEQQALTPTVLSQRSVSSAEKNGTCPSYDEIDAVMKQLEDNSDLGIERTETPPMKSRPAGGLILNPLINIKGASSSPSSKPAHKTPEPVSEMKEMRLSLDQSSPSIDPEKPEVSISRVEGADISDWNDVLSVADEGKFENRARFFGNSVDTVVGGILQDRLGPLERTLETIQHSVALLTSQAHRSVQRISTSDEVEHSDADDEEEDEDTRSRNTLFHQARSPIIRKKDLGLDVVKTAIMDALAAHNQEISSSREMDHSTLEQVLDELRSLKDSSLSKQSPDEIRTVVEEVISTHPRLRGKRVQEDHQAGASQKFRLQIDGLESLLKIAEERTEQEYRARRKVEDELAETERRLHLAAEEAAQYREASEEAECTLRAYLEEKESFQQLEQNYSELLLKNAALETTLEEYRLSHDQWRIDIEDERTCNKDLKEVLRSLRREIDENAQTKQILRAKLERVQDDMADVMERVAQEQASWVLKEHDSSGKQREMEAELRQEMRMREKLEFEVDLLEKERKELLRYKDNYDAIYNENTRLEALVVQTRQESRMHEEAAHQFERDVVNLRETAQADASKARLTHQHEVGLLKSHHESHCADLESQISRLQVQLQQARNDTEEVKARYESHLSDHVDRHIRALHELNETKEAALAEQRRSHEKAINDLRERHARALHNSSDDKQRLDAHFTEKLALSSDRIQHLEGKVADLQDRLEIASSAARAAAEAAAGKGTPGGDNDLTPQLTIASMPLARGSGIPEKISPQALRESIMVLQDQLQNREQTIESLEAELTKVDKDAPSKIKDRETEINWLRELLGVRIDDLEDIIKSLSEADYNREAVKDAVIRLKANLQMEQQERERAVHGSPGIIPSVASLSSLTQTPRALPMAAAAAWGNWRKARDTSSGTLSELANISQTPSRSSSGPQSFLSGLLTPPRTNHRETNPLPESAPPAMRPLSGRNSSSEARPLRAYSSQARSMSAKRAEPRTTARQQSSVHSYLTEQQQQQSRQLAPRTPPLMRESSYDQDADARRSIMSDLDDDASPVGSAVDGGDLSLGEPFDESARS